MSCSADTGFPAPGRWLWSVSIFWSSRLMATSLEITVLAHFAKLIKAVSAVATHGRCCRSIDQCARLKACLKAKLMRSPWVWTAAGQK